jgi:hypothetical protein
MTQYLIQEQNQVLDGLGTLTFIIPATGEYTVRVQSTFTPESSLVVVVADGVTTLFTAPAVTPTQSALEFKFFFAATAADVITVVFSSAAAIDNQLNTIKSNVSIGLGE